jgi:phosphoribosyl 1,2-cyclic phosphate phosphodiesterase
MDVVLLGSGTSHGVPVIGCTCAVCRSPNPKNKRTRSSILVRRGGLDLLIDTSTDFRTQAIRGGIDKIDAVFYTHTHADHLHGIDDLRQLSLRAPIPVYASPSNLAEIQTRFSYIFRESRYPDSKPRILPIPFRDSPIELDGLIVRPIPLLHGSLPIHGFRIGLFAYLTDCSSIPNRSFEMLDGVEVLIIDALRHEPHPTHFTVTEAIEAGRKIGARAIYLTHICHQLEHEELEHELPEGIYPAYDGLRLFIDD